MRQSFLPLLWLMCLLVVAGCSAAPAGYPTATSHQPTSTATLDNSPSPTDTAIASTTARCPQLPAAQPGQPPAAPLSLYASRFSTSDNSTSLAALNASDGSTRWQAIINRDGYTITSVAAANNIVYVMTGAGVISALNASDGRLRWCVVATQQVISAPNTSTGSYPQLVIDQGLVYAAGGCRDTILALNASNGAQRWQAKADGCIFLLTAASGQIYASIGAPGGVGCALAAFKENDGQEAWCFQPDNNLSSQPVITDGVAYAAEARPQGSAGFLDTINVSDGSVRSRVQLSLGTNLSQLSVAAGIAYGMVNTSDACSLAAFTAATGAMRWQIPRCFERGPAIGNNALYVGWINGTPTNIQPTISALSVSSGQQLWQTALPNTLPGPLTSLQFGPASSSTFGPVFNALTVVNGIAYVGYLANTSSGTRSFIIPLDGHTGQSGWRVEGVLLAAD